MNNRKETKIALTAGAFLLGLLLFVGCAKTPVAPVVNLKFSSATSKYSESQGTVNVAVSLSSKASQDIVLNYSWVGGDTATFLGGDFSFVSANPLTIKAGETSATISIQVIDDTQIDNDDVIKLTLTGATNAVLSTTASDLTHTMTITSNDVVPANQLQVDLTWKIVTTNKSPLDVNGANLDLYSQYDVGITNNQITSIGTSSATSVNKSGFETLFINATDPDKVYYIAIHYNTGSSKVAFTLALNGWGYDNAKGANIQEDYFDPTDVGLGFFLGPFTKVSNTFVYGRSRTTEIIKIRVRDFMPH